MASKKNGNNHQSRSSARLGKKSYPDLGLEINLDELQRLYGQRGCRVKLSIMDDGDIRGEHRSPGRQGDDTPAVPSKKKEYSFRVPPRKSGGQRTGRAS
jgi:hypothetical protein